ncbi:hypothetical protein IGJ91_001822 [Enterococcus sp. DIV0765f]|uniref:Uncharacterized protein n=1 Tax=Enterococcus mundtii TaxID=53346 RepID=A0AAI8R8C5_ENTMU|nr:hypothetical protein UAC_00982 [Enterococcus mundtii ATCC 882]EOU13300.1 hypothetical protein I587_01851 [Enterococcus mundtii ATCC 882]BAO07618.1 hypothetical protein EMQU_2061 [Enterococcus mundtii QU 25]BBM13954.1 uncharacterized protein EM151A_0716 [Enterococcus mundtii]GKS53640.1 hypothetical protein EMLAB_02550 [Enterococcus mundtii]
MQEYSHALNTRLKEENRIIAVFYLLATLMKFTFFYKLTRITVTPNCSIFLASLGEQC